MQGLIIINAYPNGEKFIRQGERIAHELRDLGVSTDVLRNGDIFAILSEGNIEIKLPKKYDFIIYLDKDKYLGKALEEKGYRLFNSASSVEICDDKVLTYFALKNTGVRVAKTIPAPLCYTPRATAKTAFLEKVARELSFPLVVKKSYGSFGAGVCLASDFNALQKIADKFLYEPHCYQQFFEESAGKDIRVIVVGGKAITAMERVAQAGEFRSNIELGGTGRPIDLPQEYAEAAEKAARALGLDYCGVDLLETAQGPVICEVNSNAFFEGLEMTTGINVAKKYAEYILASLS
jgi:RimK family alpha-L-glutamate ligase